MLSDGTYAFLTGFTTVCARAAHDLGLRGPARRPAYVHPMMAIEDAYGRALGVTPPAEPPDGAAWAEATEHAAAPLLGGLEGAVALGRGAGGIWAAARAKARRDAERVARHTELARASLAGPGAGRFLAMLAGLERPGGEGMAGRVDEAVADPELHEGLPQPPVTAPPSLAKVLADPDDPACTLDDDNRARLACAAELSEADPTRAAFIRLQIEGGRSFDQQLVFELARWHGRRWSQLRDLVAGWSYRRGFVDRVTVDAAAFLERAPEIYRRAPVTGVSLTGARGQIAQLAASPHLARLRFLGLAEQGLADEDVAALIASPHLGRLVGLDLARNRLTLRGMQRLAGAKLPRLRAVRLQGNPDDPTPSPIADASGGLIGDHDFPLTARQLQAVHGEIPWLEPGAVDALEGDLW